MSIVKKLFLLSAVISILLLHSIIEARAGADDVTITLGDSSGGSAFQVQDSGSTLVFQVDSLGSMTASVITVTGTASVSGTVTAGNFSTAGTVTAAGFIGDGSQLTNLPGGGGFTIKFGTSSTFSLNGGLAHGTVTYSSAFTGTPALTLTPEILSTIQANLGITVTILEGSSTGFGVRITDNASASADVILHYIAIE